MDAAVYCRISHVLDDSTIGVDRQEADGRRLVEQRGWALAALHVDNNTSAWKRNRKRPGWDSLLDDIRERRVDVVVVAHPDRLIRQPRDLEDLLDLARDTGVQLVSAGGNRDLSNPDDVFILRIEVAHACRSSDDTSRRVARGHLAAAEAGKPGGGTGRFRPYGYTTDQLHVVPEEAEVIRSCARRILDGTPWGEVVADLNARQVPTVGGGPWSRTSLRKTLTSPRTAGLRSHRGQITGPAAWPAILSPAERDLLCGRLGALLPQHTNRRKYLLSGLARCECGTPVKYRTGTPPAYSCPACGMRASQAHVDRLVTAEVVRLLSDAGTLDELGGQADPDDALDQEVIDSGAARIERIFEEWEMSGTAGDFARRKVAQIEAECEQARRRISARARRRGTADLAGLTVEDFGALPLLARRQLVAELLPDLTVTRTTKRGAGFDTSRVHLHGRPAAAGGG